MLRSAERTKAPNKRVAEVDGGLCGESRGVQDDEASDSVVLTFLGEAKETSELPVFDANMGTGYKLEYEGQHMRATVWYKVRLILGIYMSSTRQATKT